VIKACVSPVEGWYSIMTKISSFYAKGSDLDRTDLPHGHAGAVALSSTSLTWVSPKFLTDLASDFSHQSGQFRWKTSRRDSVTAGDGP
jgi:hypothetical protein